jgi:mannose-6-phosphate isomerase-like protein (cupin superfamily)
MDVVQRNHTEPFITADGSEIRELLAYRNSCIRHQSLAEATLQPGQSTAEHYHPKTEEIYYILRGMGRIKLSDVFREVGSGDAIAIPPGASHKLWNVGNEPLVLLCCCAPAYEHTDTVMVE